jgi:uncharacterized protein (TIGR03083 family)
MTTAELERIQVIADNEPRLVQEFRNLPSTIWPAPSRCTGWSNAVVAAHLAFYARAYRDAIAKALDGNGGTPPLTDGRPMTSEEFLACEHDARSASIQASPQSVCDELVASGEELIQTLSRVTSNDLGLPAYHYSGTYSVSTLIDWRIYELAFHGWDVRASADPDAEIRPELSHLTLGTTRQLQQWLCAPDPSVEATCRFEVDSQVWTVRIANGKLEEVASSNAPDAIIRTDASTFLLLATLRQTREQRADRLAIEGSRERAEQVLAGGCMRI